MTNKKPTAVSKNGTASKAAPSKKRRASGAPKKKNVKKKNVAGKVVSVIFSVLLTIMLIGIITGTIVAGVFAIYIKEHIDPVIEDFDRISTDQNLTTKIYYMDYTDRKNRIGTPVEISAERIHGSENRVWANFGQMPKYLYEAFVSIEDERFWTHKGVDWKRTVGATFYFFTGGDNYGGSTLTQQLIKNITGEDDVRIQRKLQEIMRALNLEKTKDKTEILELYLNTIYLSQGCYGVQAAANTYFNKDVSELSLVECAAIASIVQSPTKWDPIQHPDNNKYRRNIVLDKMYELGKITYSEYEEAKNSELELYKKVDESTDPGESKEDYNSWYTDAVIKEVVKRLVEEKGIHKNMAYTMVYSGGLKIYTVMDPRVQETLERIYEDDSYFPKLPGVIQPDSSMVIIDPETGDVLGLVGGRGKKEGNLLLNYATETTRPPGSSIKPLAVYAPALEEGIINYSTVYDDVPVNFDKYSYDPGSGLITYVDPETGQTVQRVNSGWPQNLPVRYDGLVNINYAIQVSKNTVAVRVLQDLTIAKSFDFLKNKLNMYSLIEAKQKSNGEWISDKGLSALALGQLNYGVTNLEMTSAYSMFINKGVFNQPRFFTEVRDSNDELVLGDSATSTVVLSEQNAAIMTKMLKNVVDYGTATSVSLRKSVNVAGKTGTTSNDYDRWFVGYTPYYIGGVWFGYAEPQTLEKVSGNPASKLWNDVMTELHQSIIADSQATGTPLKTFENSSGVTAQTVCRDSGKLMTEACRADPRGNRAEVGYFSAENRPTQYCDCHVLVDYDKVTNSVACKDCPKDNIIKVGLLKIDTRVFPIDIKVTDAQFTCRDMAEGTVPGSWGGVPYYINMLGGRFSGSSSVAQQYNQGCYTHYGKPQTTTPTTPTDPNNPTTPTTPTDPSTPTGGGQTTDKPSDETTKPTDASSTPQAHTSG